MSMRTATVPALLAVVCWLAAVPPRAQGYVVEVPAEEMGGTGLLHTHVVERGLTWDPRTIWSPVLVTLNCSVPGFSVLTASWIDKLPAASKVLWCGWRHIINPNVCELRFSMLRNSCFAVKPTQEGFLSLGQPDLKCSVTTQEDVSADLMRGAIITALAIELFLSAERLSRSQAFRLTSGGFMGVTLVALTASVFLFRTAPAKKCFSGSLLTPVGVWYVIITATAGVGVRTGLNPDHHKLHTSIRAGLQMVSLVLVYSSIVDQGLAVAAVLLLIAYGWLHGFFRYLSIAAMTVVRLVTRLVDGVRRKPAVKVMDFTQPKPFSPPVAPQAAAAGASTTPQTASRKVVNPETSREITINGSTFRELLARGFVHDVTTNTLVSPPAAQASPVPIVNVRGAPTPSSNLRSRRASAAV